jgi:hypothetical protein
VTGDVTSDGRIAGDDRGSYHDNRTKGGDGLVKKSTLCG